MAVDLSAYHRTLTLVLSRLLETSQSAVAARTGLSNATISRFKDTHLDTAVRVLVSLDLNVVPAGAGAGGGDEELKGLVTEQALEIRRLRAQLAEVEAHS